jgi:hypothetical protein
MKPKPKGRGWSRVGYSDMIHLDGRIENLTKYDGDNYVTNAEMTWGARGVNSKSRHVVYVGGVDKRFRPKDTRTEEQLQALSNYIRMSLVIWPNLKVAGHNHFAAKACPCFDVEHWLATIGVHDRNIYRKETAL